LRRLSSVFFSHIVEARDVGPSGRSGRIIPQFGGTSTYLLCSVQDILYTIWSSDMRNSSDVCYIWRGWQSKTTVGTMNPGTRIDNKTLRRINPETARQAVLEYPGSNGRIMAGAASMCAINLSVVYDVLKKLADIDDDLPHVRPFVLDDLSVTLGPSSGYNVVSRHRILDNSCREIWTAAISAAYHGIQTGMCVVICFSGQPCAEAPRSVLLPSLHKTAQWTERCDLTVHGWSLVT
jgi:hypothetical protein